MNRYKVLILTDHSNHSAENSVYALAKAMGQHEQCAQLDIASRGNEQNNAFFKEMRTTQLATIPVTPAFSFDPTGQQFSNGTKLVDISSYDVIWLRLPRPIADVFFSFLQNIALDKIIINDPKGIELTSSKAFLLHFKELCAPMKLCYSVEDIMSFGKQFPIVLKPLKEYGGKGIVKLNGDEISDGQGVFPAEDYLLGIEDIIESEGLLAMKFMKNVDQGDKRILVVNGKIMASSLRLPAEGSWLCNVAQGGHSVPSTADEDELNIIEKISPTLYKNGIFMFGADTLMNDDGHRILSEINTLSIGGFPQSEEQTGKPVVKDTINEFFIYIETKYGEQH